MSKYITELGGAISQLFNCLLLGGEANYSISSDAHRLNRVKFEKFINFFFGRDHCLKAYLIDVEKARALLKEYEEV